MKANMQRMFLLAGFLLLSWTLAGPRAAAREPDRPWRQAVWTLGALLDPEKLELEGYRPATSIELPLPPGWTPASDGELLLSYRTDPLVVSQGAISVWLNDQRVGSSRIAERAGTLAFSLPGPFFQAGTNIVELQAFLPLAGDPDCFVPGHPARWLEVGPASSLRLDLVSSEAPLDLTRLVDELGTLGDTSPLTLVLPDDPSDDELSALSAVAFALERETVRRALWRLVPASRFRAAELTGPAVLLAGAGRVPDLDRLAPVGTTASGWLRLARPEWAGRQAVLGIGGPDGPDVLDAAQALLDPLAVIQMAGDLAYVDSLPASEREPPPVAFTLAELGYSERLAKGTGVHDLIYSFDMPFAWSASSGMMRLRMAHAAMPDPEAATLSLVLNGYTYSEIRLDAEPGLASDVEVALPARFLRPGRNYIRFHFDFGTPVTSCALLDHSPPWASIDPATALFLTHGDQGGRIDLDDWPYMFGSELDLGHLALVLPVNSTPDDLAAAIDVVRTLSLPGNHSRSAPRWVSPGSLDADDRQSHLILLGSASRQPLLRDLEPFLPVPFDRSAGRLRPGYGIRLPEGSDGRGVLQVLRSPWAHNRVVLVVSGADEAGFHSALEVLTMAPGGAGVAGNLVLVEGSAPGHPQLYATTIGEVAGVPGLRAVDRLLARAFGPGSPWPPILLIGAGFALVALLGLGARVWQGRTGGRAPGARRAEAPGHRVR